MNLFAQTAKKMKRRSKKEATLTMTCIVVAFFAFLVPLSFALAIITGPFLLALVYVKRRKKRRPHEDTSEKKEEEETKKTGFTVTKKEEENDNDEKETLTNKTTTVPSKVEEKVALTGSAALMANMRRSAANTANTGEKAKISSSAPSKSGTISKEEKEETRDTKSGKSGHTVWYVLHGGEAAQQVARDVKEAMEEEFLEKRGMKASDERRARDDGVDGRFQKDAGVAPHSRRRQQQKR